MVSPVSTFQPDFKKVQKYLEDRGIPSDHFTMDKCQLSIQGTSEGWKLVGYNEPLPNDTRTAIVIYFQHAGYIQVKWVGQPPRKDCGKVIGPKNRRCPCYIPPFIDWEKNNGTLYICESPLKATAMALRGYAAVASNGIWSMWCKDRNKGDKEPSWAEGFPITAIDSINRVVILFDSDIQTKAKELGPSVRRLGDALQATFPDKDIMHRPLLALPDGHDQGIDDAIAREGDEWLHEWLADKDLEQPVVANELLQHFDELNEIYSIFQETSEIIHRESGRRLKHSGFVQVSEAHRTIIQDKGKPLVAPKEWLAWPDRDTVHAIIYLPGSDQLCEHKGKRSYNNWLDDGVEATEGDIRPFLKVYENAIPDSEVRTLLFQSLAWMLQHRGEKLDKLFFCIGEQGTGKSLFTEILLAIYGERNAVSIGQDQLTGNFNSVFAFKEVVALDDLHKLTPEKMAKVKKAVTDSTMIVGTKFKSDLVVDNYGVFFVTSNEWNALPLEHGDRRVLVVHFDPRSVVATGEDADGVDYWLDFVMWLRGGGDTHVKYWLEHMDLSGFDPNYLPPVTESKVQVTEAGKTTQQQWIEDLYEDTDMILVSPRSCYTAKELWLLMTDGAEARGWEMTKFGQDLGNRFRRVTDPTSGRPIQIKVEGKPDRYWLIRDPDMTVEEAKKDIRTNRVIKLA